MRRTWLGPWRLRGGRWERPYLPVTSNSAIAMTAWTGGASHANMTITSVAAVCLGPRVA